MKITAKTSPKSNIDNKLSKKRDRREYSAQRYQTRKQEYHEWYLQRKEKQEQQEKENKNELYRASNIQILLSLKEYTELNQEKKKLWLDFAWAFEDCQKTGFFDIIQLQKLEQVAGNLIRDYYQTAQRKSKSSWNSLSEQEKNKLIKYWSQEKIRKEQDLTQQLDQQEKQAKVYEKELELVKFHEERGKIKCECWQCAKRKRLSEEMNEKLFNDQEENKEKKEWAKSECANCYEYKKVDEESGLCSKCSRE